MATLQSFRQESLDRADRAEQAHQALQQQINTTSAAVEEVRRVAQQSAEHATLVGARVGTLEASVEAALLEANQQVQQLRQEKAALERQLSNCSNTLSLAMYRTNKQVTRHQFAASNGDRKLVLRHSAQEPLSAATIFGRTRGALSQDVRIVSVRPLTAQGQGLWVVEASSREAQQQLLSAWNSQSPGAAWQWVPADEKARRRFTSAFLFQVHRQLQSAPSHDPHATRLRALVWGVYYGEPCVAVRPEAGQPALWHSYPIGTHVPGGALFEFEPHGVNLQNVREQAERALSSRTLRGGPSTFWEFRPEQGRSPTGSPRRPPSPQAVSAARQRAQQERMAQHHQQRQQQQQQHTAAPAAPGTMRAAQDPRRMQPLAHTVGHLSGAAAGPSAGPNVARDPQPAGPQHPGGGGGSSSTAGSLHARPVLQQQQRTQMHVPIAGGPSAGGPAGAQASGTTRHVLTDPRRSGFPPQVVRPQAHIAREMAEAAVARAAAEEAAGRGALALYHGEGPDTAMGDAHQQMRERGWATPTSGQPGRHRPRLTGPQPNTMVLELPATAANANQANPYGPLVAFGDNEFVEQ